MRVNKNTSLWSFGVMLNVDEVWVFLGVWSNVVASIFLLIAADGCSVELSHPYSLYIYIWIDNPNLEVFTTAALIPANPSARHLSKSRFLF